MLRRQRNVGEVVGFAEKRHQGDDAADEQGKTDEAEEAGRADGQRTQEADAAGHVRLVRCTLVVEYSHLVDHARGESGDEEGQEEDGNCDQQGLGFGIAKLVGILSTIDLFEARVTPGARGRSCAGLGWG